MGIQLIYGITVELY